MANLENIMSPFVIGVAGEIVLHTVEASMGKMAESNEGCVPSSEKPSGDQEQLN